MSEVMKRFRSKFRIDELTIAENEHWTWSVRPGQCTLGAGVLSARAHHERFSELSTHEGSALIEMTRVIELALSRAFEYDKINYLMLMMVDPPVHFHVIPRYQSEKHFMDRAWRDAGWPGPPDLTAPELADDVLMAVLKALRDARD